MADSNLPESPLSHFPPTQEPSSPPIDEGRMAEEVRNMHLRALAPVIALIVGLLTALILFLLKPELFRPLSGRKSTPTSAPKPSEVAEPAKLESARAMLIAPRERLPTATFLDGLPAHSKVELQVFLDGELKSNVDGEWTLDDVRLDDLWLSVGVLGEPRSGAKYVWNVSKLGPEVLDARSGGLRLDVPKEGTVHLSLVCRRGSEHLVYTSLLQGGAPDVLRLAPQDTEARLTFERAGHAEDVTCEFQIASFCETNAAGEALPEPHAVHVDVHALLEPPDFTAVFIGLPGDYRMGAFRWSSSPSRGLSHADLNHQTEFDWTPPAVISPPRRPR